MNDIVINESITIRGEELKWSFSRGSGPGGQNVNKVNSKATLRWVPPSGFLPGAARERLFAKASRFLTADGEIVIHSQTHRDRAQNIRSCRTKLAALIRSSLVAPKKRKPTKPSRASRERRLDDKRKNSLKKQYRNRID